MTVRPARRDDVDEITAMVLEHAAFEGASHRCHFEKEGAAAALFGDEAILHALVAHPGDEPGLVAGFALWYPTFSSWAGTAGIWLEDLFVRPDYRRLGLGRELLEDLRGRTRGRLEWDVLDGNEGAWRFYESLGAAPVEGWTRFRWTL